MKHDIESIIEIRYDQNYNFIAVKRFRYKGNRPADLMDTLEIKEEYKPQEGDKLYLLPGCTVPRFKIKKLCEEKNVRIVKYSEKANIRFISNDSFYKMLKHEPAYPIHKSEFLKRFKESKREKSTQDLEVIEAVEKSKSDEVLLQYSVQSTSRLFGTMRIHMQGNFYMEEESYEQLCNSFVDGDVYNQNAIIRLINNTIFGEKEYKSIERMFESSDHGDVSLAMETMANSDYEKSSIYLLLLIERFGGIMDNSRSKNHVNFKALLKFFNIRYVDSISKEDVLGILIKKKLLNKTNLDIITPLIEDNLLTKMGSKYFDVTSIEPNEAVIEALGKNRLDVECDTELIREPEVTLNIKVPWAAL